MKLSKEVEVAKRAVYSLFFSFGIVYITFLSRLIEIRHLLGDITPGDAGVLLLCVSLGSTAITPLGGALLERISIRKMVRVFAVAASLTIVLMSALATAGSYSGCLMAGVLLGCFNGMFNVANNIAGVAVEKRALGRALMPRFHSFFQIGAVCATLLSELFAHFGWDYRLQCLIAAVVTISLCFSAAPKLFRSHKVADAETAERLAGENMAVAPDLNSTMPKSFSGKLAEKGLDLNLIMIGFVILASTLTEGTGNDWIAQGVVETFGLPESVGLIAMWIYLLTTGFTRFFGAAILERFGRVKAMRASFVSAFFGIVLFVFVPVWWVSVIAAIFWGFGVALGYPVCISAASESKNHSAFRASVVASMGTCMNIAGPPVIGILANAISIRLSMVILLPGLLLGLYMIKSLRSYMPAS